MAICKKCGFPILSREKYCPKCGEITKFTDKDIFINKYNIDSKRQLQVHIKNGKTFHFKAKGMFGGDKKHIVISPEYVEWKGGLKIRKVYHHKVFFSDIKEIFYTPIGGRRISQSPWRENEIMDKFPYGDYKLALFLKDGKRLMNLLNKWENTKHCEAEKIIMNALDVYFKNHNSKLNQEEE